MVNTINLSITNSHTPTEVSDDDEKQLFYEKLTNVYEETSINEIKIVLGDLNAKCEREPQFLLTIGKKSTQL